MLVGGLLLSLFNHSIVVALLIVAGAILFPPVKYTFDNLHETVQLKERNGFRENLKGKILKLMEELEDKRRGAMDKIVKEERFTTDNVHREQKEILGGIEDSARIFLANYRPALSRKQEAAGLVAADWGYPFNPELFPSEAPTEASSTS